VWKLKIVPKPIKYYAKTIKDYTRVIKQYQKYITQNVTFCFNYGKGLISILNFYIAIKYTLLVLPLYILLIMSLYILLAMLLIFTNTSLWKIDIFYNLTPHKANLKSALNSNLPT
jgi:hypothetical protein